MVLRGDAVDNPWIPVVEVRREVREKDHRGAGLGAEFSVGEVHAASGDHAGGVGTERDRPDAEVMSLELLDWLATLQVPELNGAVEMTGGEG